MRGCPLFRGLLGWSLLVPLLIGASWDGLRDASGDGDKAPSVIVRRMEVTAYCPCARCCGDYADGVTASGLPVTHNDGRFVAADTDLLPIGTLLRVPGYAGDDPVPVLDRGGAIRGERLDVFFADHEQARQWGRRTLRVEVVLPEPQD